MRKIIFLACLFLYSQLSTAQSSEYKNLITLGDELAFNFDFDSCNVVLNNAIQLEKERPEAFLLKSKIHLWYFLGSKDQTDYDLFFDFTDSVVTKTDLLLEENDEDLDLLYQLGNVYKYRAMAYGNNGSTLDAFWSTKKAVSFFEDIIDLDSNYYSAYGGIGVFEYALSYVPALFNWALSLSGLSADQNNGFEFIELASEKANYDNYEYQFHLSKLYDEHLADYNKSISLLNPLLKKFPNNGLFHYQVAIEYIKSRKLKKAVQALEQVLEINHPKFIQTNSFSNFLLGDIYFRENNYSKALEYYLTFLTTSQTIDYTGIASLRAAYCFHFLDNDHEFRKYLLLATNGNLDLEDDNYASKMGLLILKEGFTKERKILLNAENSYLAGENSKSLEIIENNLDSLSNYEIIAEVGLIRSKILIEKKSLEEAKPILEKIDSLEIDNAEWIEPLTKYYQAEISYLENNIEQANIYLEDAEDSNDYQKKNYIQSLINGLKRKLGEIN